MGAALSNPTGPGTNSATGARPSGSATNSASAATNRLARTTDVAVTAADPNDPVEKEFQQVMKEDDDAQAEVDKWIKENDEFAAKGAGMPASQLKHRIETRFETVRKGYEDFLKKHPNHARGHVAFAGFLHDIEDEDGEKEHLETALSMEKNDPAIYNNLANIYGHHDPVKKAFEYYTKAIELNPREPVYYQNFGTTVYLFRTDVKEYYHINEDEVFAKAFELYSNAMRLDPLNFELATDVAQTYYGIQPMRVDEALRAWTNTLKIAANDIERQGVYVHMARINAMGRRFEIAHAHLAAVTDEKYNDLKRRVTRMVNDKEKEAKETNAAPEKAEAPGVATPETLKPQTKKDL